MPDVFISYAKTDRTHALDLAGELRAHGFSVWIDQGSIGGAKNWTTEIVEAINACSTFLCLLSPHSLASQNVAKELHLASEKRKNILPVLIERVTLPANFEYSLAGLQRVYYQDRPAIFQALEVLRGLPATEEMLHITERTETDDSIRIAVLPFDDLSPNHDNQWFADGMMDELISTLGGLERMKIPGRSDVLHYREHRKKGREISSELGVRYLIEGGVRKSKEKIRINASLTDTLLGEQLWTNKFDGTFEDVFAFQELVAKNITDALKLKLTPGEKQKVEEHGTDNAEAYELYLKGRHEQYYYTKESYIRALDLYEKAAKLDPKFSRAHVNIASVCCVYYREYSRNPKWLTRAEANLKKAEATAGDTSRTLSMRGTIEWMKGNDDVAIVLLTRAASLDSKNLNAFNILGSIYSIRNESQLAIRMFQRAVEISESAQEYFNLFIALKGANENERLAQTAQQAISAFDRYLILEPEDFDARVSRGLILFWSGRRAEAEGEVNKLLNFPDMHGHTLYNLGVLYDYLGKPELRISLFRRAIDQGYREIELTRTHSLHSRDSVHESEFQALVQELELLVEKENQMVRTSLHRKRPRPERQ